MGLLDSIFGSKPNIPAAVTVNPAQVQQETENANTAAVGEFGMYGPAMTQYVQALYNSTVNPAATQAQATQYALGNQLATQGYTSAQSNFFNQALQHGQEAAAANGVPVGSGYNLGLGATLGSQTVLNNQLQGASLLSNYAGNQQALAQSLMQPSLNIFNSNLLNTGQALSVATNNANSENQLNVARAQAAAAPDPAASGLFKMGVTVLGSALGSIGGPIGAMMGGQIASQAASAGTSGNQSSFAPFAQGWDSSGIPIASQVAQPGTNYDQYGVPYASYVAPGVQNATTAVF